MSLSYNDMEDLRYAKMLLENPSLATKIINLLSTPFEKGLQQLPMKISGQVQRASHKALETALNFAIFTMGTKPQSYSADRFHKLIAATSGGAGGFFGLAALAVELPVTTTIILRSVADIARSEGENIRNIESKLACLEVFALGGNSPHGGDSVETGYYVVRSALSRAVSEAAAYLAEHGLTETGAPILVRLIAQISSRFGIVVSEKVAATAIPVVGAAGGAIINTIFMEHFQDMARGHFIIRRLEKIHGKEFIRTEYEKIEKC